jgi:hypothetical protein
MMPFKNCKVYGEELLSMCIELAKMRKKVKKARPGGRVGGTSSIVIYG